MARYLVQFTIACMTRQDLQSLARTIRKDPEVSLLSFDVAQTQGKLFLQCQCSDRAALDAFMKRHNLRSEDIFRIELEASGDALGDV